jgi:GT2 family glycosyltransferase
MEDQKVFIVILNWNRLRDTLECLKSVYGLDYENFVAVVVDNGSTDDSVAVIRREYPRVSLLENKENLGYTGGNNIGMHYAMQNGADYVWLLNNDTVVAPDCLSEMVEGAEKVDSTGLVSPVICSYDNESEIQFTGGWLNWKDMSVFYLDDIEDGLRSKDLCLWGTALLVKRQLIEKIGYLKGEYFAYWEDIEYSLRSAAAGYKNIICSTGRVFHKNKFQQTDNRRKGEHYHYFIFRNRLFLGNEYLKGPIKRLGFWIRYFASLGEYIGQCGKENIDPCMNGAWHGIKGISGPMINRDKMPAWMRAALLLLSRHHPSFLADLLTCSLANITKRLSKHLVCK